MDISKVTFDDILKLPQDQAEELILNLSENDRVRILQTVSDEFVQQVNKELEEDLDEINEINKIIEKWRFRRNASI